MGQMLLELVILLFQLLRILLLLFSLLNEQLVLFPTVDAFKVALRILLQ